MTGPRPERIRPFGLPGNKVFPAMADKAGMIIQASHMNLGTMQQAQTGQSATGSRFAATARSLPSGDAGSRLADGLSVRGSDVQPGSLPESSSQTLGLTVANEIVRRMASAPAGDNGQTAETSQVKDTAGLRDALASTLDWVRDSFGDETGAAASGMLLAATSGEVSEATLGDGLLDVLRFIDRTQGIASGDQAIARFNSGINGQLNAYFDNGRSELFYAVQNGGTDAGQSVSARSLLRAAQATAADSAAPDPTAQLLDALRQDLEETAGLQDLASRLEGEFGLLQENAPRALTQAALTAYADFQAAPAQFLDMAV